ncbi:uncharacterized protein LOC125678888 [Ostrea edulis]|uniref:uncharacterized protein LOC125678888 n=1 Tax=Ostrea edulis TaxID=37623 RepID=UPI0024AEE38D|nr:uncharacterized protein LOC125678888 [Ostrea edulis]
MGARFSYESASDSQRAHGNDDCKHKYIDDVLEEECKHCRDSVDQGVDELASLGITDYKDQFPFENLVFEGGGAKGVVYPGALLALEELGILKKIKRIAGTSVGSMTACMLALGYNSQEIRKVMKKDFSTFFDARFGHLSLLPNLLRYFGWQPMNSLYKFTGELVEEKLGSKDATFMDLYNKTGKELCVVVTNVNNMEEEYFHPKTTPDVPIRLAVRMSASIPGLMQPVHFKKYGHENVYVDGGLLANYPITCFDGWWLSMEREDSFFKKIHPLEKLPHIMDRKHRFARDEKTADKTLGFVLYAEDEKQSFKPVFEDRRKTSVVYPDTKMGRKAMENIKNMEKLHIEDGHMESTVNKFLELTSKYVEGSDEVIRKEDVVLILNDEIFTERDKQRLFGKDVSPEHVMNRLDRSGDGNIKYADLVAFVEEMGFTLVNRTLGYERQKVSTFFNLLKTLYQTMSHNITQIGFSSDDLSRTIGLNSHYVGTLTFDLEEEDMEFLNKESYQSTMAFLKNFAATKLKPKDDVSV